jgi:nicotinate-nucleotide pyrophosphorylase (carboxylating)
LTRQLQAWLEEDLGRGDLTRAALLDREGRAEWIARRDGVFCGGLLVEPLFRLLDPFARVESLVPDGARVREGQRVLSLVGQAAALVAELDGTGVKLVDTRKTTPGLRIWEKYAVRCGGGVNHRFGLDDAAMLKENHLAWSAGIGPAVAAVRATAPWPTKVIVEAETEEEACSALRAGVDGVLLDGFAPEALGALVPRLRKLGAELGQATRGGMAVLEASGVAPDALRATAASGVDLISTSAPITRSPWLDLSMRFVPVLA